VRLLVISDIHSNLEALRTCLDAAPAYDRVVNLGDVVGYGASPNEVVGVARSLSGVVVRGNHDRACSGLTDVASFNPIAGFAAMWTRMALTADNLEWVKALPMGPVADPDLSNVQWVHGSPLDEDAYLLNERDAHEVLDTMDRPVTFFGHTHIQCVIGLHDGRARQFPVHYRFRDKTESIEVPLQIGTRYLINPGSIGQPRDGDWRAGFAIFDAEKKSVIFYRVPYPVELAQQRIISADLPVRLAARLREGR
jgi:diadenosine tetraphosphatase ApaH/serine/threonine PP2A family protein phosphatase